MKPVPDGMTLSVDESPSPADGQELSETLFRWNMATVGVDDFRPFAVWLRDGSARIRGGCVGWSRWDWAHIDTLWVDPDLRGQGHGKGLLEAAEALARARHCRMIDLDTFSFQAPGFYASQDYEEFAVLDGISHGVRRHHFRKPLEAPHHGARENARRD